MKVANSYQGISAPSLFRAGSEPGTLDTASGTFRTGIMTITPAMAGMLLKHNKNNRSLRPQLVRQYAEDMRQGNFEMTHQGIAFYANGDLADGQHRLQAIVESGISQSMLVTVGEPMSAHIDIGAKRTEMDAIHITNPGLDWVSARAVAMLNILKTQFPVMGVVTLTDKQTYLAAHRQAFEFALDAYHGTGKGLGSAAIYLAFAVAHMDGADADVLAEAAELLSTGMLPPVPNPASNTMLALRNYLQSQPNRSGGTYNRVTLYSTAHMLHKYIKGQSAVRVMIPTKFPFGVYDMRNNRHIV